MTTWEAMARAPNIYAGAHFGGTASTDSSGSTTGGGIVINGVPVPTEKELTARGVMFPGTTYDEALHDWTVGVCQNVNSGDTGYAAFCSTAHKAGLLESPENDPFGVQANINCLTGKGDCVEAIVSDALWLVSLGWSRVAARTIAAEAAVASGARPLADRLASVAATRELQMARMLSSAKAKGFSGIGGGTRAEAQLMGEAWVGPGFRTAADGKILISSDGLRQYRAPSFKPNRPARYGGPGYQANFEWRVEPRGMWLGDAHLDITDAP